MEKLSLFFSASNEAMQKKKAYMENIAETLERLIDAHGLTAVVDYLCQVCYDKADHIRSSHQDEKLAKKWDDAGKSLVNPKEEVEFPS